MPGDGKPAALWGPRAWADSRPWRWRHHRPPPTMAPAARSAKGGALTYLHASDWGARWRRRPWPVAGRRRPAAQPSSTNNAMRGARTGEASREQHRRGEDRAARNNRELEIGWLERKRRKWRGKGERGVFPLNEGRLSCWVMKLIHFWE
uniref:Uncharacterized protein n=1 Tax=Setaria italica TaxID=4555 RepID=K3XZS5_SETIT